MNTDYIKNLLYEDSALLQDYVSTCERDEELFIIANNYNWGNGLAVPKAIIDNKYCSLSTALCIFYLADGDQYFLDNSFNKKSEWGRFVSELHDNITNHKYPLGYIAYEIPLSKVQIYKLKKLLSDKDLIFITSTEGEDVNITL